MEFKRIAYIFNSSQQMPNDTSGFNAVLLYNSFLNCIVERVSTAVETLFSLPRNPSFTFRK